MKLEDYDQIKEIDITRPVAKMPKKIMWYTAIRRKIGVVFLETLMKWLSVYQKKFHENNWSMAVTEGQSRL